MTATATAMTMERPAATAVPRLRILRDTYSTEDRSEWSPHGSGGNWRRRQTDGILKRHGVEPISLERPPAASIPARLGRAFALKRRLGASLLWTRRSLGQAEYSYRYYGYNARRAGFAPVALLEFGIDPVAIMALKDAGIRVVVALSGLNSLWRSRPSDMTGPYPGMFLAETRALAQADAVFCISREEQWILNNVGISAQYLPYFPDAERETDLLAERQGRQQTQTVGPREFMICASRGNSDTVDAFREQAEWICRAVPEGEVVFNVTGHQTEEIREIWSAKQFVFHGTCTDEKFRSIKQRSAALCLHQRQGVGALTRIPDMLLSGLPIIANGPAARSFIGTPGLHLYDTAPQFRQLLRSALPVPPVPLRPLELEDAFFAAMQLQ